MGSFLLLAVLVIFKLFHPVSGGIKYQEDSEEEQKVTTPTPRPVDFGTQESTTASTTTEASEGELEDLDTGLMSESEEDLPEGFDVIDGIVMDVSNVFIQEVKSNRTEFKPYRTLKMNMNPRLAFPKEVVYTRPKEEAGWHFILFEDPDVESPGEGRMILMQKLLGFLVTPEDKDRPMPWHQQKEQRLYQAYHIDLDTELGFEEEDDDSEEKFWRDYVNMTDTEDIMNHETSKNITQNPEGEKEASAEFKSTVLDAVHRDYADEEENHTPEQNSNPAIKYQDPETIFGEDTSQTAKKLMQMFEQQHESSFDTWGPNESLESPPEDALVPDEDELASLISADNEDSGDQPRDDSDSGSIKSQTNSDESV